MKWQWQRQYRLGMYLADYVSERCHLCRQAITWQSKVSQYQLADSRSQSLGSNKRLNKIHAYFKTPLLCPACHHSLPWLPSPFYIDLPLLNSSLQHATNPINSANTSQVSIHNSKLTNNCMAAAPTEMTVQQGLSDQQNTSFHSATQPSAQVGIQPATYYQYPIRQAITAFKYQEDMTKLPLLVHVLRQLPRPYGCHGGNSVIIPMPTTSKRLRQRGFDPVSILVSYLSLHWQIPIWQGVARVDDTIRQQGLSRAERMTNLQDAFSLMSRPPVKRLLLFDDVATTGASLRALAHTLHTSEISPTSLHLFAYCLAHGS